ncbi:WGR domain-containing protein [Prosthecobacter sp.]|jgi:bifunctional non-homologous end joining protein LigD|uniref:ATP-dependent DNA ligase n=1 Tax=Prosthecobacter sp. TaxID=1965333 RepID=UPI0037C7F4AF
MEHITLYFREGSSDKIYQAAIQPNDGGYVVHFAYGRRGSALTTGTKTQSPVDYPKAKSIFDKLVREKTGKGYTPGESGTPYQHSDKAQQATDILPQLLNPIDQDEAVSLACDPQWVMQEKFDGRRLLIRCNHQGTDGINRSGLIVSLPQSITKAVEALNSQLILDGECVGEKFIAFDLLELDGTDLRSQPYRMRLVALNNIVPSGDDCISTAATTILTETKKAMLEKLKSGKAEGVVFKRLDALYTPGRPASGGPALKLKFYETASFLVSQINEQRSVSLALLRDEQPVPAGNVTIPPNHVVPSQGDIVEVRYLYAFPESGCVYQPVYLGRRDDIQRTDCTTRQLKFKAAA